MVQWEDRAFILSVRPYGESGLIVRTLTEGHGKRAGMLRGGQRQKRRAIFEAGNLLGIQWSARLDEQLGYFEGEVIRGYPSLFFDDSARLSALLSALAIVDFAVPEREDLPEFYQALFALLEGLDEDFWPALYVKWELSLLGALGYALDLSRCAISGKTDNLVYVSPRSGRAVSRAAGAPYSGKLLTLPAFLQGARDLSDEAVVQGLKLSGHFLRGYLFHPHDRDLPVVRDQLERKFL